MNQATPTTGPELPKPQERLKPIEGTEMRSSTANEKVDVPPQAERLSAASGAVSQAVSGTQMQNIKPATQDDSGPQANPSDQSSSSSLAASDVDVMEKAWVQKAKTIVDKTKDDPHKQATGLSYVKHDYINERFHKDIKLPGGSTPQS